jgi:hypothetical protein
LVEYGRVNSLLTRGEALAADLSHEGDLITTLQKAADMLDSAAIDFALQQVPKTREPSHRELASRRRSFVHRFRRPATILL